MRVAIVDYGSGNLHSARKAFERAACEAGIAASVEVTADPAAVRLADRIVLPGVGAFADCAQGLRAISGMTEALEEGVRRRARPFLGICVGMQLLATRGLEYGIVPGLGWIAGEVVAIEPADGSVKIPHMGWNTLVAHREHPLLSGIATTRRVGTPISCIPFICGSSIGRTSSPKPIMADRSRRWWRATTSRERNFIPRRARRSGSG